MLTTLEKIYYCIPIVIIIFGLLGNTITILILRFDKNLKKITGLVYLSFVILTDTISLFQWNLDIFVKHIFEVSFNNKADCNIFTFMQFFSLQSSGCLLSILCIDRYITVVSTPGSFYSRLPFRTRKSAVAWSLAIIAFVFIVNSHILFSNPGSNRKKLIHHNISNASFIEEYNLEFFDCQPFHSTGKYFIRIFHVLILT